MEIISRLLTPYLMGKWPDQNLKLFSNSQFLWFRMEIDGPKKKSMSLFLHFKCILYYCNALQTFFWLHSRWNWLWCCRNSTKLQFCHAKCIKVSCICWKVCCWFLFFYSLYILCWIVSNLRPIFSGWILFINGQGRWRPFATDFWNRCNDSLVFKHRFWHTIFYR